MTEVTLFFREFTRTRRATGAVAPSSPRLARALTRYVIPSPGTPRAVLEVGPGTGAVTRHVRESLGPLDTLDLVEANPRFAALLAETYAGDRRVRVLTGLVQDAELGSYDTIVCGLPFANFDAATAGEVLGRLVGALRPGGTLSYFAYAGMPPLRRALTTGRARLRVLELQSVIGRVLARHRFRTETVLGNLPPAHVHHLAPVAPGAGVTAVGAFA
ncbi:methyltransferase [Streptomyces sp. NPDC006367]|uniref:class I SAM-dependent methyltransferase n=1 Tax=unclassified Streptomyces TaxID=2593676 RepID=UPI0033AA3C0B